MYDADMEKTRFAKGNLTSRWKENSEQIYYSPQKTAITKFTLDFKAFIRAARCRGHTGYIHTEVCDDVQF